MTINIPEDKDPWENVLIDENNEWLVTFDEEQESGCVTHSLDGFTSFRDLHELKTLMSDDIAFAQIMKERTLWLNRKQ